jgi:Na+/melibiose symporter-like transporter
MSPSSISSFAIGFCIRFNRAGQACHARAAPGSVGGGAGMANRQARGSKGKTALMAIAGASDGFSARLAAFYAALFVFAGIVMPFFPVWLEAKGLDSRATGVVLAVPMLMRLVSVPLIARRADRRSAFRAALIATSIGSVLA